MAHLNHMIYQVAGIAAVSLLTACSTQQQDVNLQEVGVSHELARFRKEHFGQVRYNLFFSIPESRQEPVRGKAVIQLSLKEKLPLIIDFRGNASQVASVLLNGGEVPYEVKNEHIIILAERSVVGENKVSVEFTPADQSLNRRDEFLYTLLVPDRARTAFPCFDQPDMKSLFTLTLEVPEAWQAVTNGAIEKTDTLSIPGRKLISFRETEPLSTYLFAFTAGKFIRETYTRDGREISLYHRETDPKKVAQCPEIASEVFDALTWLEDYTAIPYPFAKYDLIILPGFQFGGMEHTGATFYTDRRMFLNENPTLNEQLSRSALIAHETAHMWFGDYVTMQWFDDVWTKEVFANYFASQIVEPLYPGVNHALNFMQDYIPPAYVEDRTAGANPIKQELDNLQDQWAYLLQQMDDLELKMANKSDEIDAANVKLEEAEKIQSAQYEDMKLRIKNMYEDQSVSLAEVFLTSSDMSTMLNKAVYMQEVYNYDRNKLDEMAQTASEIKELKEKLESDKQELDEAQTQLTEKQALLYSTIQETQAKADDVNSQLESAVKKAAEVAAKREQERQAAAAKQNQQINTTVTPAKGDSSVASGVVSLAYSLLGVPYVSGGSSPSGFDCSGFTSYLFRQYGISISRSSSAQAYGGTAVNGLANAQPGDVICYPGHVGLYVGGGQMIHANVPGGSVRLVGVNSIGMSVIAIRRYW